jgi:plasmid maintenance system antidote protein VapI
MKVDSGTRCRQCDEPIMVRTRDLNCTPKRVFCSRKCSALSKAKEFWSQVNKQGAAAKEELGACWEWTGFLNQDGYGHAEKQGAHRTSWEKANGPIPNGLQVCHKCDNRRCVNPSHLFLGAAHDNRMDAVVKNRIPQKLKPEDVTSVLQHRKSGLSLEVIAEKFGVSVATISLICAGKSRLTVTGGELVSVPRASLTVLRGHEVGNSKLLPGDILEIRRLRQAGLLLKDIAVRFGISNQSVLNIATGKSWKHVPFNPSTQPQT